MKTSFKVLRYVREWDTWQILYKEWYIFGFRVWRRVIDREDIPRHVYIQYLALGDWHGWKSKFYEYI